MVNFRAGSAGAFAAACLVSHLLCAAPALTTIQDVLYKADGSKFNGILQITWTSFQAADTSNIPTQSVTTQVNNGYLHVLLVPTTNAATAAVYNVVYNSDGRIQFSEIWVVPPSTIPLRVVDVRRSSTAGTVGALSQTQIVDVSGLRTELNIRPTMGAGYAPSRAAIIDANGGLTGASGGLSDCVHVDGSSGPCGTSSTSSSSAITFIDAEIPTGAVDGVNSSFQLANTPSPTASVEVFRNGLALQKNTDFTVSGATISFQSASVPQPGDVLAAFYRTGSGASATASFIDAEAPSGTVDGVNAAFSLVNSPSPTTSLELFRNGLELRPSTDFTVSGSAITFQSGSVPQPGDVLQAFYRAASSASVSVSFGDGETPSGAVDGSNVNFGLSNSPSPASSLELFRNGLELRSAVDYSLSGATITFQSGNVPQPGDALEAFYRTAASGGAGTPSTQPLASSALSCTLYTVSNNGTNWTVSTNGGAAVAGPAIMASTVQQIPLFTLPAKGTITGIREKTTTAWGSTAITAASLWIGDTIGGASFYVPNSYDLTVSPGDRNFLSTQLFKSATDGGSTVVAYIVANGLFNAAPVTGSVGIDVCWVALP